MASLRQIRGRIKSIQNSKQIMRAMQLVSGSKLKRSQDRLLRAKTVLGFLDGMLARVLAAAPTLDQPLCRTAEGGSTLVIFTSDAGLCGSYNTNLIHLAESYLRRDSARRTELVFVGKRGWRYFTTRGRIAVEAYLDLAGRPSPAKAEHISRALMQRFLAGQTASISVLYSKFVSPMMSQPTVTQWLPIQLTARSGAEAAARRDEYLFEPSAGRVFEELLPRWAMATLQLMMLEAFTCEHSARMIAMKNATDNAQRLLDALLMQRNKIRQAAITKELSEIVGTAEALK